MKKSIYTLAALLTFALLGIATSEDKFFDYPFYDVTLSNESDSCSLANVSLVNRFSRSLMDTTSLFPSIEPRDTVSITVDSLEYIFLLFDCACPSDTLKFQTLDGEMPPNNGLLEITVPPCE